MTEDGTHPVRMDQQQHMRPQEDPISTEEGGKLKEEHLKSSHLSRRKTGGSRPTGQLNNAIKLQPSTGSQCAISSGCIIILEERNDLPVFWNGKTLVPMIKTDPILGWNPSPSATIEDFLSTFVAGNYLRKCTMSLQVSTTKYINDLRMLEPFSKILDHQSKEGNPVTLMLSHSNEESTDSGYAKYILYVREGANQKIFWSKGNLTSKLVAKLNQADMSLTIGSCLKNYIAKGYVSQNCQVDLVQGCADSLLNAKEKLNAVALSDLVQTLFLGNSATIVVRNSLSDGIYSAKDEEPTASSSIAVFLSPTPSSHWVGSRWNVIRDEVAALVISVEETMRDRILPTDVYASIVEKKTALESAIRRRSRVVDEVWQCFRNLQRVHMDLLNENNVRAPQASSASSFETPRNSSVSVLPDVLRPNRAGVDGDAPLQFIAHDASAMELLSETLIQCGMELELYDQGDRGRMLKIGIGLAVFVAICTIVYYF